MPIKQRFDNYQRKTVRTKRKFLMPSYTKHDIYLHYKKDVPHKAKTPYNINKKTFSDILDLYNISLMEIYKTGVCLALPHRMGGLQLVKIKAKVNPLKPERLKENCTFKNDFYIPVSYWVKRRNNCKARIKNIKMYSFNLTKETRNLLNKMVDYEGLGNKLFTIK